MLGPYLWVITYVPWNNAGWVGVWFMGDMGMGRGNYTIEGIHDYIDRDTFSFSEVSVYPIVYSNLGIYLRLYSSNNVRLYFKNVINIDYNFINRNIIDYLRFISKYERYIYIPDMKFYENNYYSPINLLIYTSYQNIYTQLDLGIILCTGGIVAKRRGILLNLYNDLGNKIYISVNYVKCYNNIVSNVENYISEENIINVYILYKLVELSNMLVYIKPKLTIYKFHSTKHDNSSLYPNIYYNEYVNSISINIGMLLNISNKNINRLFSPVTRPNNTKSTVIKDDTQE